MCLPLPKSNPLRLEGPVRSELSRMLCLSIDVVEGGASLHTTLPNFPPPDVASAIASSPYHTHEADIPDAAGNAELRMGTGSVAVFATAKIRVVTRFCPLSELHRREGCL